MPSIEFPALSPGDIEIRVATVNDMFIDLLLYKDARVDMRMLDSVVGPMRWQRRHESIEGVNYCTVSILGDDGEWVSKQDCGTGGDFEKDKSSASDAFKRACFNWGIGRELYTVPSIRLWNSDNPATVRKNNKGKFACYDAFRVARFDVERHIATYVEVVNDTNGKTVYRTGAEATRAAQKPDEPQPAPGVDVEKNKAVVRLKDAIAAYADRSGGDVEALTAGVKKRSDYQETAWFYNMVAEEFESA